MRKAENELTRRTRNPPSTSTDNPESGLVSFAGGAVVLAIGSGRAAGVAGAGGATGELATRLFSSWTISETAI